MKLRYFFGAVAANAYRLLRVFPNSDPIMAFILPAAKNEPWWKAPLFAFATMFSFDLVTSGIGKWTFVTAITYSLIALAFRFTLKGQKSSLRLFLSNGVLGVLAFDLITGPIMGSALFGQPFGPTFLMQIPFTIMHLVSAAFAICIISPFFDAQIAREIAGYAGAAGPFARAMMKSFRF